MRNYHSHRKQIKAMRRFRRKALALGFAPEGAEALARNSANLGGRARKAHEAVAYAMRTSVEKELRRSGRDSDAESAE